MKIIYKNRVIYPEIIYSKRKSIGIQITKEGAVKVKAPYFTSDKWIEKLLLEKRSWIEKTLARLEEEKEHHIREFSLEEIKAYRKKAREQLVKKTAFYSRIMNVTYEKIFIKDQKTCWGSCSRQGNLNFNWRLILMPEEILDYVVVHELAHRKQLNHSPEFWKLVEKVLPDYKLRRQWLKKNGSYFIKI